MAKKTLKSGEGEVGIKISKVSNAELRDIFVEAMELLYKVFADLNKEQENPSLKIDKVLARRRLIKVGNILPKLIKRFE